MPEGASGSGDMVAVRWHARGDVRVDRVPLPHPPRSGELGLAVCWCGICGTDVHEYLAGPAVVPVRPHPGSGLSAPMALGHEISARITSVGDGVQGFAVGDLVVLDALIPCGTCPPCKRDDVHLCERQGHLGMSADGGLAEFLTVPTSMAVLVPAGVPEDLAALAEPMAVAFHAVQLAGELAGPAVVLGAGTIGLCVAALVRDGGGTVTVLDTSAPRRGRAAALGFAVGEPHAASIADRAASVFECSGAAAAAVLAPKLARSGGLVVVVGLPSEVVPIDVTDLVLREIRIQGSVSHTRERDLRPAIAFVAEHLDLAAALVTARIDLVHTVRDGLDVLADADSSAHTKILVRVAQ